MIKYTEPTKLHQWAFLEGLVKGTAVLGIVGQFISAITEAAAVYDPSGALGVFGAVITTALVVVIIEGGIRYFAPIHAQSFFNVLRGFKKGATQEDLDLRKSGLIVFVLVSLPLAAIVFFSYQLSQGGKDKILESQVEIPVAESVDSSQYNTIAYTARKQFFADSLAIVSSVETEKQERIEVLNKTIAGSSKELSRLKGSKDYDPNSSWFKNNIGSQSTSLSAAKKELKNINTYIQQQNDQSLNAKRAELNAQEATAGSVLLSFQSKTQERNDSTMVAFVSGFENTKRNYDWIIFLGIGFVMLHAYLMHLAYYLAGKKAEYIENPFDKSISIGKKLGDVIRAKSYLTLDSWIDKVFGITDEGITINQRDAVITFKQTNTHTQSLAISQPLAATQPMPSAVIKVPQQTQQQTVTNTVQVVFDYSKARSNLKTYLNRLFTAYTPTVKAGVKRYAEQLTAAGFRVEYIDDLLFIDDKNNPTLPQNSEISFEFKNNKLTIKPIEG
jgi:hypothetical protein